MFEKFGFDDAMTAAVLVEDAVLKSSRVDPDAMTYDGLILGSGLGNFADRYMENGKIAEIPFNDIFKKIGADPVQGDVPGHARKLIIAHLDGAPENALTIAQAGREHLYEGVDPRRATFWLRVMQILGTKTLFGSNAAGIVTPETLQPPALMVVRGDHDYGNDNPLVGHNDDRFGPRFPHMGGLYSDKLASKLLDAGKELDIPLHQGVYFRVTGPHYESHTNLYHIRNALEGIYAEARKQKLETDFQDEKPVGLVGMSSTYEARVAQHASQSATHPAFQEGVAYVSVSTNYSASRELHGFTDHSTHEEVQRNAKQVEGLFGRLIHKVLTSVQNERNSAGN